MLSSPKSSLPAQKTGYQRKKRIQLSCEECRRTKAKCDRNWPCSNCRTKGLAAGCPNAVSKKVNVRKDRLEARLSALENQMREAGIRPESTPGTADPGTVMISNDSPESNHDPWMHRAVDTSTQLAELTNSSRSHHGPLGTQATAFYLSSPEDSETEEDGRTIEPYEDNLGRLSELCNLPWAHGSGKHHNSQSSSDAATLTQCRDMLPGRSKAEQTFEVYWNRMAWRNRILSRSFFVNNVLSSIYDSEDGAHPHELAVLFTMTALVELLEQSETTRHNRRAARYQQLGYACLVLGHFYTETTPSSLIALHLLAHFVLNTDDLKGPDAVFSLAGLAVKLAVIDGYHRENPALSLTEEQLTVRRTIWHEVLHLERANCLASLTPISIQRRDCDTRFPSDASLSDYSWWKWTVGMKMSEVVEYWTAVSRPDPSTFSNIDASIRTLWHSLPPHLRCPRVPKSAFPTENHTSPAPLDVLNVVAPEVSPQDSSSSHLLQSYRLALHFCMVFYTLHRPVFMKSLIPGNIRHEHSIQTVTSVCEYVVLMVEWLVRNHPDMSRWYSFIADVFTILHCQTALVLTATDSRSALERLSLLQRGINIVGLIASLKPTAKHRSLSNIANRLGFTASWNNGMRGWGEAVSNNPNTTEPHVSSQVMSTTGAPVDNGFNHLEDLNSSNQPNMSSEDWLGLLSMEQDQDPMRIDLDTWLNGLGSGLS